jgi:hypothetical protein
VGAVVLAVVVLPVAMPLAEALPLRTVHVAVPQWWRSAPGPGVVLAYPYPSVLLQSPLSWQAHGGFAVSLLGGSGPQGSLSRAGADTEATAILWRLSGTPLPFGSTDVLPPSARGRGRPPADASTAAPVRAMVVRDGVTEVVVPVRILGRALVTGLPSAPAAVFFAEVLGVAPVVADGAWVFRVPAVLPAAHLVAPAQAKKCADVASAAPTSLAGCLGVAS